MYVRYRPPRRNDHRADPAEAVVLVPLGARGHGRYDRCWSNARLRDSENTTPARHHIARAVWAGACLGAAMSGCGRIAYDPIAEASTDAGGDAQESSADAGTDPDLDAAMAVAPVRIYWADSSGRRIRVLPLAGGTPVTLVDTAAEVDDVCIDSSGQFLYWGDADGRVMRARTDETELIELTTVPGAAFDSIACDTGNAALYLSDDAGEQVLRVTADGTSVEQLVSGSRLMGLALDGTGATLYAAAIDTGEIAAIDTATGDLSIARAGLGSPIDVHFDAADARLYWIDRQNASIGSLSLAGGPDGQFAISGESPSGLVVDDVGGKIYWSTEYAPTAAVWRAELDGSAQQVVSSESGSSLDGMALGP